jgi:hypothetical protein
VVVAVCESEISPLHGGSRFLLKRKACSLSRPRPPDSRAAPSRAGSTRRRDAGRMERDQPALRILIANEAACAAKGLNPRV